MIARSNHPHWLQLRKVFRLWCSITAPLILVCPLHAQWEIPVGVVLDGPAASDRQVLGLDAPLNSDGLISAGAERRTSANFTSVVGTVALSGTLTPAPSSYTVGMAVTVIPEQANAAEPSLDLNGLGPRPLVKSGSVPLDSADLFPGRPVRLIYDGTQFQVLSSIPLACPSGFHSAVREFCIADSSGPAISFFAAAAACSAQGARLCTSSEWAHACSRLSGFLATVSTAEWVDHAANNAATAKVVGAGNNGEIDLPGTGCNYGGWGLPANPFRYRCCTNR